MAIPTWVNGQVLSASDVDNWFVPLAAYKTANTSRSNTTLSNDPDLTVSLTASAVYTLDALIIYDADQTGDIKTQWAAPAGMTMAPAVSGLLLSANGNGDDQVYAGAQSSPWTISMGCAGVGVISPIFFKALVTVSSTAGSLTFQWAQATTSAVSTTVHAGSWLRLFRVG